MLESGNSIDGETSSGTEFQTKFSLSLTGCVCSASFSSDVLLISYNYAVQGGPKNQTVFEITTLQRLMTERPVIRHSSLDRHFQASTKTLKNTITLKYKAGALMQRH